VRALALVLVAACGGGGGGGGGGIFGTPDAPPPAHSGGAGVSIYKGTGGGSTIVGTSAYASFDAAPPQCPILMKMGNCYVEQCSTTTPMHMYENAGSVHITGTSQPITLDPAADNTYMSFTATADLAQPGDMLTVTADGTTVPGYTETLVVPSKITITSPAKPAAAVPVSRAADYTIAWSGGSTGDVELAAGSSTQGAPFVYCQIPSSAGTGTIPAALLSMLPAGMGSISAHGWSTMTKQASDWGLYFSIFYDAIWPDDSIASITVTFN
jgi:hypothetical protein